MNQGDRCRPISYSIDRTECYEFHTQYSRCKLTWLVKCQLRLALQSWAVTSIL